MSVIVLRYSLYNLKNLEPGRYRCVWRPGASSRKPAVPRACLEVHAGRVPKISAPCTS